MARTREFNYQRLNRKHDGLDFNDNDNSGRSYGIASFGFEYEYGGYNNIVRNLEQGIKDADYRTLSVEGLEYVDYRYSDLGLNSSYDGKPITGVALEPRIITVNYELVAGNSEDLQLATSRLARYAYRMKDKGAKFHFNEYPEYYIMGRIVSFDKPPAGVKSFQSSFDIYCEDPCFYSNDINHYIVDYQSSGAYYHTLKFDDYQIESVPDRVQIQIGGPMVNYFTTSDLVIKKFTDDKETKAQIIVDIRGLKLKELNIFFEANLIVGTDLNNKKIDLIDRLDFYNSNWSDFTMEDLHSYNVRTQTSAYENQGDIMMIYYRKRKI